LSGFFSSRRHHFFHSLGPLPNTLLRSSLSPQSSPISLPPNSCLRALGL
jgi:hypothetical protein